jgi:hypothetical protein
MVRVYAFIIRHTIAADLTSRAVIKLVNEKQGYFRLEQIRGHLLTEYTLTFNNPTVLGFSSTEGIVSNNRINDIILAMNLTLEEAALSRKGSILSRPIFSSNERIMEDVHAVLGMEQQQLDESIVISNLKSIDKVDRHKDHKGNTTKHNLSKALCLYESAFNQRYGESIFRYIFNAVEDAINWDKDQKPKELDEELSAVANVATSKATQWRCIYNRLKDPDHGQQATEYLRAKSEIPYELVALRLAANRVFSERLKNVSKM